MQTLEAPSSVRIASVINRAITPDEVGMGQLSQWSQQLSAEASADIILVGIMPQAWAAVPPRGVSSFHATSLFSWLSPPRKGDE